MTFKLLKSGHSGYFKLKFAHVAQMRHFQSILMLMGGANYKKMVVEEGQVLQMIVLVVSVNSRG